MVGVCGIKLPLIPDYATNNTHIFYPDCASLQQHSQLTQHLDLAGVKAVFYYQSLYCSPYFQGLHDGHPLPNVDDFTASIVRLPMCFDLSNDQVDTVCERIISFIYSY
ncbi:DegT/DnrJ/EryC1/StrS family aminotransferase [Aeromonas piscicola]|uniref:DegT/DnrJ/EryC1/StrS family aminotransferase n=1 Tax=Aeromonas piscicola TaxID=600645 RepID=UPI0036F2BD03